MHPNYSVACKAALNELIAWTGGNKSQLARVCGVTRNAVSFWVSKGYIGRETAMAIDADKAIPFTKEQLRPDIKFWTVYKAPPNRKR